MSQATVAKVKQEVQHVTWSISIGFAGDCAVFGVGAIEICELEVGVDAVGAMFGANHGEVDVPSIA